MKYRQLDANGDMKFGASQLDFLKDSPATVGQACLTALKLWLGEWYLNLNEGTPYPEGVLGKHSKDTADQTLINVVRNVQGVVDVNNWFSTVNPDTRNYSSVSAVVNTIYGLTQLEIQNLGNF